MLHRHLERPRGQGHAEHPDAQQAEGDVAGGRAGDLAGRDHGDGGDPPEPVRDRRVGRRLDVADDEETVQGGPDGRHDDHRGEGEHQDDRRLRERQAVQQGDGIEQRRRQGERQDGPG